MAKKLYSSADREKAHAFLERALASGKHPNPECREDYEADEPFEVWDNKEHPELQAVPVKEIPEEPAPPPPMVLEGLVEATARRVVELLGEQG